MFDDTKDIDRLPSQPVRSEAAAPQASPIEVIRSQWQTFLEAHRAVAVSNGRYWLDADMPEGLILMDVNVGQSIRVNSRDDALWIVVHLVRVFGLDSTEVEVH